ncbi:MAG: hypothetical protein Q7S95_01295 [bacterium]|nr:hypothetical protein [bacterium]
MANRKTLLLVGDNARLKEFAAAFAATGTATESATDNHAALAYLKSAQILPDGVAFIVPVYWESVGDFVKAVRSDPVLEGLPIVYLGDFIEAADQVMLKRAGVHTLTLGPVPTSEAVRYILKILDENISRVFEPKRIT